MDEKKAKKSVGAKGTTKKENEKKKAFLSVNVEKEKDGLKCEAELGLCRDGDKIEVMAEYSKLASGVFTTMGKIAIEEFGLQMAQKALIGIVGQGLKDIANVLGDEYELNVETFARELARLWKEFEQEKEDEDEETEDDEEPVSKLADALKQLREILGIDD